MSVAQKSGFNIFPRLTSQQAEAPESWSFEYQPGDPDFPAVPFGLGLTIQIIWLTPDLAADFLAKLHPRQRTAKAAHLDSLVEDHVAGRFVLNGEPIICDSEGYTIDGRHRCLMVIETGKPAPVVVIRNLPPEVYCTLDNGAKRSAADALRAFAVQNATLVSSAAKLIERYRRGFILSRNIVLSSVATTEIWQQYPGLVDSAAYAKSLKRFASQSAIAMCHYVLTEKAPEAAEVFFEGLKTGANLAENSPVLQLRNRLYEASIVPDEVIFYTFKAWNYFRGNKPMTCLKRHPDEKLSHPV